MRYIITYFDANHVKQIRFFKSLDEATRFMKWMRKNGSNVFYDFKIKIVKPS